MEQRVSEPAPACVNRVLRIPWKIPGGHRRRRRTQGGAPCHRSPKAGRRDWCTDCSAATASMRPRRLTSRPLCPAPGSRFIMILHLCPLMRMAPRHTCRGFRTAVGRSACGRYSLHVLRFSIDVHRVPLVQQACPELPVLVSGLHPGCNGPPPRRLFDVREPSRREVVPHHPASARLGDGQADFGPASAGLRAAHPVSCPGSWACADLSGRRPASARRRA